MKPAHKPKAICSIPLCGRERRAHGYCMAHYMRHKKGQPMDPPINFRILRNIDKDRAVLMWIAGNCTATIAETLRVSESYIYNRLPSWRGCPHDGEHPMWRGD